MTRNDLRKPEVLREIGKLRGSGMSFRGIAKSISGSYGVKLPTVLAVQKAYEVYTARQGDIIEGDKELQNEIKGALIDTKDQLIKLNELMWTVINDAETSKDKISAAKEVLNQMRFQETLITKVTDGFDFKKMNKIEITKIIVNNLEQLEKDGFIKILTNPGSNVIDIEKVYLEDK